MIVVAPNTEAPRDIPHRANKVNERNHLSTFAINANNKTLLNRD